MCPTIKTVVVYKRTGHDSRHDRGPRPLVARARCETPRPTARAEPLDSEHPLYILYTSGSTGKPKGILHTTGGYLVGTTLTTKWVFDLKDDDTYFCTADIGWVTGHSYLVYGPLANGATVVMYEGAPNWPDEGRFWKIIEDYRVSILYTAPTAIRAFMKWGEQFPRKYDLSSLRLLGTRRRADQSRGVDVVSPRHRRRALPDRRHLVADRDRRHHDLPPARRHADHPRLGDPPAARHRPRDRHQGRQRRSGQARAASSSSSSPGRRCSGPSTATTSATRRPYWSEVPGCYFTGDGARRDEDGNYWIMGRVDDVLNVAGHRLSTMEVESALVSHPKVAEAAVVGKPDELKGQAIAAFVTLESGQTPSDALQEGAARPRRQGDRRPAPARRDPVHRLAAQDPQRQDHAPTAPRHRRRPREHRRHLDARRPGRAGQAPRGGRGLDEVEDLPAEHTEKKTEGQKEGERIYNA